MFERSDVYILPEVITDLSVIRQVLRRRIYRALFEEQNGQLATMRVVRIVLPIVSVEPFIWLQEQRTFPRIYWRGREDQTQIAAVGAADLCGGDALADYDTLREQLDRVFMSSDPRIRYFGGFRFDRTAVTGKEWAAFGTYKFVLPRFELSVQGTEVTLACNLVLPRDRIRRDEILEQVELLSFPSHLLSGDLPVPISRCNTPNRSGWDSNVNWALEAFDHNFLDKIVLARKAVFGFEEPLNPVLLLKKLCAAKPNCYHFLFQPNEGETFLGATPERLFLRDGRTILSEAVAGTRPRGDSEASDARLRDELFQSVKERREHEYVRRSIKEGLVDLCKTLHIDAVPSEMMLASRRHLVSNVEGTLYDGVVGSDVMAALQPTSAVGGYPTDDALKAIRQLEPFDRGWYAGPVGWIGSKGAEFVVAIRSGLVQPYQLYLYSGAGIVQGSTPDDEWNEIEQKIDEFIKVLGLN